MLLVTVNCQTQSMCGDNKIIFRSVRVIPHISFLALLCFLSCALCYKDYQDRIPNGLRVPHPCKDNYLWHGVGHMNSQGGGSRNVFGLAFAQAGHTWTRELCQADSDGDGRSNGEELGDPRCVWTPGTTPEKTTGITHPGICEPLDNEECQMKPVPATAGEAYKYQKDWIADACQSDEFVCPHLNTTADVRRMELRLPPTAVPPKETTYMCAYFDFENVTTDFHIIATTPIINNSYVMHHMLLFGCTDDSKAYSDSEKQPFECSMGGCSDIIGAWTVGLNGECFNPMAGFKAGRTGYKRLLLQYHWNNPFHRSDLVDSSGLTLYYTPNLRPYNLGTMMTGQNYLEIPPYMDVTIATSDCTATCTRNLLQSDIYITDAINHMHYLGKSMYIEHHRDGQFLQHITEEHAYSYDSPAFYGFENPVLFKPGDVLRTTCHFKSTDKATTTFQGESTSDEMCFGFLMFYPAENMANKECVSTYNSIITCDPDTQMGCDPRQWSILARALNTTSLFRNITSMCKPFGVCTDECKSAITTSMLREPCMKHEDSWALVKYYILANTEDGRSLLAHMLPCEVSLYKDSLTGTSSPAPSSGAGEMAVTRLLLMCMASVSVIVSWGDLLRRSYLPGRS